MSRRGCTTARFIVELLLFINTCLSLEPQCVMEGSLRACLKISI